MEWAVAHGIRREVADVLVKKQWEVAVLLSSEERFVRALCHAGEEEGPATKIWLKLQSQCTARSILRARPGPSLVDLMPSLLLALPPLCARFSSRLQAVRRRLNLLCAFVVHVVVYFYFLSFVLLAFGVRRNVG